MSHPTWKAAIAPIATIVLCAALVGGCVMHSIVPENADTTTADTIYQVAEKEAFIAVLDIYAVELAKQSVDDVVEGKYRGYSSDARFGLDWTTHRVLVIPARGVDKSGKEIRGYRYDIRSSGSRLIENPLRHKRIREMLQERLASTAAVVTSVRDGEYETNGEAYLGLKRDAADIKAERARTDRLLEIERAKK
jgi:hypothetical protein